MNELFAFSMFGLSATAVLVLAVVGGYLYFTRKTQAAAVAGVVKTVEAAATAEAQKAAAEVKTAVVDELKKL